jgi:hypothetical protein
MLNIGSTPILQILMKSTTGAILQSLIPFNQVVSERMLINVRENLRGNQEWRIQRHWQQ